MEYPEPVSKLVNSFSKLPGIGKKTATRLAFYVLDMDDEDVKEFSENLVNIKNEIHYCKICGNITTEETCDICRDPDRDQSTVIVVENVKDIMVFDEINEYNGLYHVLGGVLSPIDGIGADELNISQLLTRLKKNDKIKEVIIATNATPDGETTASYLAKLIKPSGIKVTRLAHGLSAGSDIEYADELTLQRAILGRREL